MDQYITINTNGLISNEMEQKITKLLYEVYPEVFDNHNTNMVQILNKQFKVGPCPGSIWVEHTGYTIDELWDFYTKSSKYRELK